MTRLTPETEDRIRDLGRALKLYNDFLAAADFSKEDDLRKMGHYGMAGSHMTFKLADELGLQGGDDIKLMEQIVEVCEQNGSDAADELKAQLPKVHAVDDVMRRMDKEAPIEEKMRAIRKALKP